MARSISRLMDVLDVRPLMAVGHSAGAAVALRLRLDARIGDAGVVSLNGALQPFKGAAGQMFPAIAKLLFLNPIAIQMFAWRAGRPGVVARLLETTGSTIDAAGLDYYGRLLRTTGHIEGALGMMANWNLRTLVEREGGLPRPLTLVVGEKDYAVPPSVGQTVAASTPGAILLSLPNLGHLAHEEAPDRIATIVREACAKL
jgi:magnesium chelatase accessory protein